MAFPCFTQFFLDVPTRLRRLLDSTLQQSAQGLEIMVWIIHIIHIDEAVQLQEVFLLVQSCTPNLSTSFPGWVCESLGKLSGNSQGSGILED